MSRANSKGVTAIKVPIEWYDAEKLYKMKFQHTARIISKMDTMQKAKIAAEIQPTLDSLYEMANRYGNPDYEADERIGPAQFQSVMGKIKHWETLLYWLYEIDIMIEEAEIEKLVREAKEELAKVKHSKTPLKAKMEENYEMQLQRKREVQAHTDEIMELASSLTAKYFG